LPDARANVMSKRGGRRLIWFISEPFFIFGVKQDWRFE
jgi:hypothetical protein